MMDRSQDTAHLTRILLPSLILVLMIGLLFSSPHRVFAQHETVPENWIEMRKMFRYKGPLPTIEEDLAAIAGGDGGRAAIRLIDRGPDALPAVHAALRSPEIGPTHAFRLLQVMGALAEKSSVSVVLEFLKNDKNSPLCRDALYVLALLPVTEESAALIIDIANDVNEKWNTRRMAFTWFGFHRAPRGRRHAESDTPRKAGGLMSGAASKAVDPIAKRRAKARLNC